jgi:endoglucanase
MTKKGAFMKSLIQKLVEVPGPSGYESQVREVVRAEVEPLVDHVSVDALGNLIARKGEILPGGLKIMLAAHLDEIGVMVNHIDERGFARFVPIGGDFSHTCLGVRVRFLNGLAGVIGTERLVDVSKAPTMEQLFIDVGASRKADCPLRVGDIAAFERPFQEMGRRLVSKAMDDRIGVAVLIETLRRMQTQNPASPHQLFFVFSVQEEVGARGATTAAFSVDPDVGLAVDVTSCGDTPKGRQLEIGLGKGPAIKVRDKDMLADPRLIDWMVATAERAGLPHQLEILPRGSTDARAIQLTRAGVLAGGLLIPCRYVHTPSEMVDLDDVHNAVLLLTELLTKPVQLI